MILAKVLVNQAVLAVVSPHIEKAQAVTSRASALRYLRLCGLISLLEIRVSSLTRRVLRAVRLGALSIRPHPPTRIASLCRA